MDGGGLLPSLALEVHEPYDLDGVIVPPPDVAQLGARHNLLGHDMVEMLAVVILETVVGKDLYGQISDAAKHPRVARRVADDIVGHYYPGTMVMDAAILLDKYGHSIEYDFHRHLGLDVSDWFRGRYPWEKLPRLVFRLPFDGFFRAEYEMDFERAETVLEAREREERARRLDRPEDAAERAMSTLGFTGEVSMLTNIFDAVRELRATVAALAGSKAPPPVPTPRPRTAETILRERRDMAMTDDLLRRHGVKL